MRKRISEEFLDGFVNSCRYLNINVLGKSRSYDPGKAFMGFAWLASRIPDECDVWVGIASTGELTEVNFDHIVRTWHTYNRLQTLVKLPPNTLTFTYSTGLYIDFTVATWEQLQLARSGFLIRDKKFHRASEIIDDVLKVVPSEFGALWMKLVLNYRTGRWNDVIQLVNTIETDSNIHSNIREKYQEELITAKAVASAYLGRFHFAYSLLKEHGNKFTETAQDATFIRALILRAQGDEGQAKYLLEKLYSYTGGQKFHRALTDPSYTLEITTEDKILARTNPWDPHSEPTVDPEEVERLQYRRRQLLQEADKELENFIGLQPVKDQVRRLRNLIAVSQEREARSLSTESKSQHLVFAGPPGTGKTTIARVIAKIYSGLGVMKKDTITEVNRAEIVGQHIGETEHKMNALIDQALDGILFIDEAYALVSTGAKNDFGLVAINTLLARMENDRSRLVVIIAGYPDDLNKFLSANEGLRSRFSRMILFESYTPDELIEMAVAISRRRDTIFSPGALLAIKDLCSKLADVELEDSFKVKRRALDLAGNARFVRNIIERSEEEREDRLGGTEDLSVLTDEELKTVTEEDIEKTVRVLLQNLGIQVEYEQ